MLARKNILNTIYTNIHNKRHGAFLLYGKQGIGKFTDLQTLVQKLSTTHSNKLLNVGLMIFNANDPNISGLEDESVCLDFLISKSDASSIKILLYKDIPYKTYEKFGQLIYETGNGVLLATHDSMHTTRLGYKVSVYTKQELKAIIPTALSHAPPNINDIIDISNYSINDISATIENSSAYETLQNHIQKGLSIGEVIDKGNILDYKIMNNIILLILTTAINIKIKKQECPDSKLMQALVSNYNIFDFIKIIDNNLQSQCGANNIDYEYIFSITYISILNLWQKISS